MGPECTIGVQASTAQGRDLVEFPVGLPDPGGSGCVQTPRTVVGVSFEGFEETEVAVAGLVAWVRSAVSDGSSLEVMEAGVRQGVLAAGRAAVQDGLNAVSAAEVRRHDVSGPEGTVRAWATAGRSRTIVSLFGPVTFSRIAYRGPGVPDVFPADEQLDLPAGSSYSRAVEQRVGYLSAKTVYRQVAELIQWETGTTIGTRQLRQIAARAEADAETFARTRAVPQAPPLPQASQVQAGAASGSADQTRPTRALVATFDGKGVVMRPEARRTTTGRPEPATPRGGTGLPGHGEQRVRRGRKRLAELSCLYDVRLAPRTPEQILRPLTNSPATSGDSDQPPAPAPRASNRWLQASLTATIDQVVADTYTQADRRDPDHQQDWIALVDGAWPQIDAILTQATARGIHIPILIDLLHVLGYLWDAANATFNPGAPAAATWVTTQARALLEGHPDTVIAEIRDRTTRFRPTGTAKDKILAAATYLDNHRAYLDYPTALTRGWPIATGVIEGACKNLVCDRMDVAGAKWGLAGAQTILDLRALTITDSYPEYWEHHTAQQHARQYPHSTPAAA